MIYVKLSYFDADGNNVTDKIVVNDSFRNILIPVWLKGEEVKIHDGFLEDFKFYKIDVTENYIEEIDEQAVPVNVHKI